MRIPKKRDEAIAQKYQRWTVEADAELLTLRSEGRTIRAIADVMKRTRIGILERLKYLRRVAREGAV